MDFKRLIEGLNYECNRALCSFLATLESSKVSINGIDFLQLTKSNLVQNKYDDTTARESRSFYLPSSTPKPDKLFLNCPPDLLEFYQYFDGLREEPPGKSGYFYSCGNIPKFMEDCPDHLKLESSDLSDLLYSPEIFCAANGDRIILSPNDGFLWYQVGTGIPILAGETFEVLLSAWIQHHSQSHLSFTSYVWQRNI